MKILTALILCLSCLPCFSQDKSKKPERTCRVIYLQRPADAPTEGYLFDGAVSHKVSLSGMNFSDVINLPQGDLTIGMTSSPVLKPEDFPAAAPKTIIRATITELYLVVVSDPDNKVFPVRILPVDAGTDRLKMGQTLWINLTTHQIGGKLGDETLVVPPRAQVVGKAPLSTSGYCKVLFFYQPVGQKEFLPVMDKSWWFDTTSKNIGFIIDSGGRLPKIFTFRDFRDPVGPEKKE